MTDIVERLLIGPKDYSHWPLYGKEAADEIERLQTENWQLKQACGYPIPADKETPRNPFKCGTCDARQQMEIEGQIGIRAATIEECKMTISDVFASTSPRDYMMNGSGGILKRMIDALHALKERQT